VTVTRALAIAALCLAAAASGSAQAPVVNARVERLAATRGLAREIQAVADRGVAAWIGYRVPIFRRAGATFQTTETCCGRCRLEPPTELIVLARVESTSLVEIRPVSVDCDIDAAGMPLIWFDAVNADDSVAWLTSLLTATDRRFERVADKALVALALHASPAAAPPLVRVAREGATTRLRGQALFWLAQRVADQALPAINAALDDDPELEVKKRALFALSQMKEEGLPRLMEVARTHKNAEVRRQAMFWLGQSKDPRAVTFFEQILLR
jgi:hypothetical protein